MKGDSVEVVTDRGNMFRVTEDNEAACKYCGASILWCITAKGKKMPVDILEDEGPTTSHFDTCPEAEKRRP